MKVLYVPWRMPACPQGSNSTCTRRSAERDGGNLWLEDKVSADNVQMCSGLCAHDMEMKSNSADENKASD